MTDQTSDEAADVECWAAFELAMPNTATRTDEAWRGFQVGWQARAQHAQQAVDSERQAWAVTWHKTASYLCTVIGINPNYSAEEMTKAAQETTGSEREKMLDAESMGGRDGKTE